MTRMRSSAPLFLVCVATLFCAPCIAQTINAKQIDDKTVRVTVPGQFETTITKRKGFVANFWDLKNDPEKKFDLGPVRDENGILWTKTGHPNHLEKSTASWYAAPCDTLEILEAGPLRVRVKISGVHCRYGKTWKSQRWPELGFEQTFTMYPNGATYIDYVLIPEKPLKLHHFLLIIKSTGSWGKEGKGKGKDEVHAASESGKGVGKGGACLALQWSNGPTHFQDFLMVMQKGKYRGSYWGRGFRHEDWRTALALHRPVGPSLWPDDMISAAAGRHPIIMIPAGRHHIMVLFRMGREINSPAAALRYALDYRSPDTPKVAKGELVKDDPGDHDGDGFNEAEGCYVFKPDAGGKVDVILHGAEAARIDPTFKVMGWQGEAPKTIQLDAKHLAVSKDYMAQVVNGSLLVQVLGDLTNDAELVIAPEE